MPARLTPAGAMYRRIGGCCVGNRDGSGSRVKAEPGGDSEIANLLLQIVIAIRDNFLQHLHTLLELVQAREAIGLVGVGFLFLGSSLVFGATETALKEIFERKPKKLLVARKKNCASSKWNSKSSEKKMTSCSEIKAATLIPWSTSC